MVRIILFLPGLLVCRRTSKVSMETIALNASVCCGADGYYYYYYCYYYYYRSKSDHMNHTSSRFYVRPPATDRGPGEPISDTYSTFGLAAR